MVKKKNRDDLILELHSYWFHEIKNILGSIGGTASYAKMELKENRTEKLSSYIDEIIEQLQSVHLLTVELFHFWDVMQLCQTVQFQHSGLEYYTNSQLNI